jgi:sugar lactone lactonase YvrE
VFKGYGRLRRFESRTGVREEVAMAEFTTLVGGLSFPESPRWRDGRLYFSDFHTHRVLAVDPEKPSKVETIATLAGQPCGIGWLPDGRMLVTSKHERLVMRMETDGSLVVHCDLTELAPASVNDMLVDRSGHAWVGNYGFDLDGGEALKKTGVIGVWTDGAGVVQTRMVTGGLGFPNGMVMTPDGRTMIVAETFQNRLTAFDVDGGCLSNRRTWAAFGAEPKTTNAEEIFTSAEVVPDGICLDAEGAVWVADVMHARVIRVVEGGEILEEIGTGGRKAFACMLGGADGKTLFACVAASFVDAEAAAEHRGEVLMTRVSVPGAGLP